MGVNTYSVVSKLNQVRGGKKLVLLNVRAFNRNTAKKEKRLLQRTHVGQAAGIDLSNVICWCLCFARVILILSFDVSVSNCQMLFDQSVYTHERWPSRFAIVFESLSPTLSKLFVLFRTTKFDFAKYVCKFGCIVNE